jgi:two-component system cell cycle sensor histidine kinase/response regulator CckA
LLGFLVHRAVFGYRQHEKQRQLISEVMEGSRSAHLITDSADNLVFSNQRFDALCRRIGPPGLGSLANLFKDNEEAANLFRNLAEQAQRGLSDSIELAAGPGEQEKWFIVGAQPIGGWAGYVHWRIDDVTKQRELDRSVREEREKLLDFTDNAPVGFFSVDEHGRFVFVNATLARWLGTDIEKLLSRGTLHAFLKDLPETAAPYDILAKGGARQIAEITLKGAMGKSFLASINQMVVTDDDGRVRTRAVVHDLTQEREMRQALQSAEDRFQRFFEEAPLGIALIDPDGVVRDCNTALAAMLGEDIAAIEGRRLKDLIAEEDRLSVSESISRIEKGQRMAAPIEMELSGKERATTVQMHARKFRGGEDIVLHFIDLSEQKQLEQQFVQSQKMQAVGQLAGGIAHDFNNLLTAMIGFCDLLLLRHKPGDPSFGDIMQIKQNGNRAANLVRQLLAFSRQQTLRPKVQDVTDILIEASHLLRRLIGANIELELVHGFDLGLVKVDVGQMDQVLVNLAVNARDAMEGGGKLAIITRNFDNDVPLECAGETMPPGAWVEISVTDTGTGIAPENIDRILEPFFTTKEVGKGTGLGLATVYGIIRQTGGYMRIESELGKGTSFIIYLPRLSEAEAGEEADDVKAAEVAEADLTGTARIMLVEDEDAVRSFSTRALTNKGYEVLAAENGAVALDLWNAQDNKHLDLMVTDVMMPDMDGPTLAKKMREQMPDLKIIFISGYTEDRLKDHMGTGIYFLPKPFTLKQLAAKIKEAMEE